MSTWIVPGFAEERPLGRGASGRVVAAVHQASGTRVAIKYLSLSDPGFLAAFRDEASLLRTLNVPEVVRFLEYVEAPGQGAAIVMELVDGVSLHDMITRQGPASAESALAVLKGSLLGLAAAHRLGIVHRDYKPENVLVDRSGQSKLTDFGVAARTGQAADGGTPLYMAPEQWNGAPASPATDIYAATAVFFECLTGHTPYTGNLSELATQHATGAVPYRMVDEPLQELIARGLAKNPAYRPSDAAQFMTELQAIAASAYGPDWEERGRRHLAERAAALLLLLLPHAATAAGGTGTATASTTLAPGAAPAQAGAAAAGVAPGLAGAAAAGAAVAGAAAGAGLTAPLAAARAPAKAAARAGLHGWQIAAVYTGLFVVVFGGVGGGLVATHYHDLGSTSKGSSDGGSGHGSAGGSSGGSAGGKGGGSGAGGASATAGDSAVCGSSGLPALAYVPQTGSGTASAASVVVRCGTGTPQTLASGGATSLAWSSDGSQLAWTNESVVYVAQAAAGKWSLRHWTCECDGIAFLGDQAVSVNQTTAGGPEESTAGATQLVEFPASGTGQPTTLPVTGITGTGSGTEFRLLGGISPGGVVVDDGESGGSDLGGFQSLYLVNSAGQATPYGPDTPSSGQPSPASIFGDIGNIATNRAGTEIAFDTFSRGGACGGADPAQVLDVATKAVATPAVPAGGGAEGFWTEGKWFDQAGTAYVSLVPNSSTCSGSGTATSGEGQPASAVPIVCKLEGSTWVTVGTGIFQAAYGPGDWLAEETGRISNYLDATTLTVSDGTGTTPATVRNTSVFAWAP